MKCLFMSVFLTPLCWKLTINLLIPEQQQHWFLFWLNLSDVPVYNLFFFFSQLLKHFI